MMFKMCTTTGSKVKMKKMEVETVISFHLHLLIGFISVWYGCEDSQA